MSARSGHAEPMTTDDDQTPERLDGDASAKAHLSALPAVDISATTPRGPDQIPFDESQEEPKGPSGQPMDPLGGIPSVPANVIAGVPESQVTDRQSPEPNDDAPAGGGQQHPPASSAP